MELKHGKVIEMANRASIQKLSAESISGLTSKLDNHESGLNTNAHGISNIAGLQTALDDKADSSDLDLKADMFTGFTGSFSVVTHVDFPGEAVTTKTITVSNGVIVSVV